MRNHEKFTPQNELDISWLLVDTQEALARAVAQLTAASGPVAIDTERASGYRHNQKAYLVQVKRKNSAIFLIDPIAVNDLTQLAAVINKCEWILHAGSNDLPQLTKLGLHPTRLWDTQLAAQILGDKAIGLGAIVENLLRIKLNKTHSAENWATRPIPVKWQQYAALDVALLHQIKAQQVKLAKEAKKSNVISQEMRALLQRQQQPVKAKAWHCKLSGINKISSDIRALKVARALYQERLAIAERTDIPTHQLLPDSVIIAIAEAHPRNQAALNRVPGFRRRYAQIYHDSFWRAIVRARRSEMDEKLKDIMKHGEKLTTAQKQQRAAAFKTLDAIAQSQNVPRSVLLNSETLKQILIAHGDCKTRDEFKKAISRAGARKWQGELICDPLWNALQKTPKAKS
ncbi:HRDC domain-containing protein [Canibacter sp. lx-72]|uniref:HRDC domain-containing protein n=1 Tax=Canibacter zhuwentaonis TaxID=2837491 RepID=UPI001BDDC59E|nr:HRDC domain-containing protein [Canibacter zhuwentaonis]MBT1017826.1 HRDC domain-containing protein [Canibacter zhuwentaonis]